MEHVTLQIETSDDQYVNRNSPDLQTFMNKGSGIVGIWPLDAAVVDCDINTIVACND